MDLLAAVLVDASDLRPLAVVLHDTSCRCTNADDWSVESCREFAAGRYTRWAREFRGEVLDAYARAYDGALPYPIPESPFVFRQDVGPALIPGVLPKPRRPRAVASPHVDAPSPSTRRAARGTHLVPSHRSGGL